MGHVTLTVGAHQRKLSSGKFGGCGHSGSGDIMVFRLSRELARPRDQRVI